MGNVRNDKTGRILSTNDNGRGYLKVGLCKNKKQKKFYVHRLVAEAFIPNNENLLEINHKDENKKNNCVDNLEWCTREYNMNYGTCSKRSSDKRINNEKISKKVKCIEKNIIYASIREANRQTGISQAIIIRCCKGRTKMACGYHWEYVD